MSEAEFRRAESDNLRERRLALRISQTRLAEVAGVSLSTISRWERGVGTVSAYADKRLGKFFKAQGVAGKAAAMSVSPVAKGVS